jgi:four helix bundle protein
LQRFSDLRVWKRSHRLALGIYEQTVELPKSERFGLTAQLRRAAVSVAANIAEGSKRPHAQDYARFLDIARGSLAETECLLLLCRDLGFCSAEQANRLVGEAEDISRMLNALRRAVLRQPRTSSPQLLPTPPDSRS